MAADSETANSMSSVSPPVRTMMTVFTSGRNPWDSRIASRRKRRSPAPVCVPLPCCAMGRRPAEPHGATASALTGALIIVSQTNKQVRGRRTNSADIPADPSWRQLWRAGRRPWQRNRSCRSLNGSPGRWCRRLRTTRRQPYMTAKPVSQEHGGDNSAVSERAARAREATEWGGVVWATALTCAHSRQRVVG